MKRNAVVDNKLTKEMIRGKDGGKKREGNTRLPYNTLFLHILLTIMPL